MGYSDSAKNAMLTLLKALASHASLHSDDPGTTGANELSGGSPAYARQAVTIGTVTDGEMSLTNQPIFDVPAGFVRHIGFWTAASGGTFLGGGVLNPAPEEFTAQGLLKILSAILDLNSMDVAVPEGVMAATLAALTASCVGYMVPVGTGAMDAPSITADASGYLLPQGTGASDLPSLTAAAEGSFGQDISGTAAADLPALTASVSGLVVPVAEAAAALPSITASASGGQAPLAPTGHSVDAGDTLVTMHPGTSDGATSYNAYWTSDGSAPSKTNGTQITGVADAQEHTSLTNGTLYKYVFTAVSSLGEGPESSMVSATPSASSVAVSDDFNRTNESPLTTNWSQSVGNSYDVNLVANRVTSNGGAAYWDADTFANNQYSSAYLSTLPLDGQYAGVTVRQASDANTRYSFEYLGVDDGEGGIAYFGYVYKTVAGTKTQIGGVLFSWEYTPVRYIRIEVSGTTLIVYRKATAGASWGTGDSTRTDSAIASGAAGVTLSGGNIDDWAGGDL